MAEQLVSGLAVQDDATAVNQLLQRVVGAKPKLVPIAVLRRAILLVLSTFTRQRTGAAATDNQVATFGQGSPEPNKPVHMGSPPERDLANLGLNVKANGCFTFDHLPTDEDTHLYLFGSAAFTHLAAGGGGGEIILKLNDTQTRSSIKVFGAHVFGATAADEDFTVSFGEQDIVVRGGREYCLEASLTKSDGQPVHVQVNGTGATASNGVGFVRKQNLEGAYDWALAGGPVIPAARISDDIARASAIPTTLDANQIVVNAGGFDGNLATTDDDVQKVAQKLDDLVIASGNAGLDQDQVDARANARISSLVLSWVLKASRAVIPDNQLPPKLREVIAELTDFGWIDEGNVAADNAFIGPPRAAKYTQAQITGLAYAQTFNMSPANVNWWVPVRIPDDKVDERFRILFAEGDFDEQDSQWEQTAQSGGYTYFQVQIANLPVAIFKMQRYEEAFLSGEEVDARIRAIVPAWARGNSPLEAPQTLAQFTAKKNAGTLVPGHWYPISG